MNYEVRRDEQLYVPPARLLDDQQLYWDFFYNHPPGAAWFFHGMRLLTGSDYLLLDARLGMLVFWLLLLGAVGLVSFALTRSGLASWCITILFAANELFLSQTGMTATNNLLPLPFSFLGLGLFVLALRDGVAQPALMAVAGFCLSVAVVFKLNAIAFVLPIAVAAFFLPRTGSLRGNLKSVVPLALGGLVGGLPILYYLVSEPDRFLAHVVDYHVGPHATHGRLAAASGDEAVVALGGKVKWAFDIWLASATAIGLSALLALILMTRFPKGGPALRAGGSRFDAIAVLVGALGVAVVFSLLPTPSFPQYYAPPLLCLPLALALFFGWLRPEAKPFGQAVLIAAAVVVLLNAAPRLVQHAGSLLRPQQWTVSRVHAAGVSMADRLAEAGVSGKVATLAPLYVLEGGLDVYPELATGLFAYRTGDLTPPELAKFYKMTSPTKVAAMLEAEPPAALLLGFEPELEAPLLAYAQMNGYLPAPGFDITDRYGTAQLYVRPEVFPDR
ncbi:hypothetical protein [Arvimicrobium flavum]|uniref:hypothetical protein n=1 Tax=Arvimicrobium flavum TaxID=3393320 RepID=UPI00237B34B8|nr:hypothetical protein [Mesorhizobium shangrilense]